MHMIKGLIILGTVLPLAGCCHEPPCTPKEAQARQDRMLQMLEDTSNRNQNQLPKANDELKASWRGRSTCPPPDMSTGD